jgi:hypothetical protein
MHKKPAHEDKGKYTRVVLLAAQRKTLHFMDGASLYLHKYSYAIFAQSAKTAQNCIFAPSLHFLFSS